jgi:hypothetical protein
MKLEKRLEHFLKWVDEHTYWKEDNDVPNHVMVRAYMQKFEPTETNTVLAKREGKNVRSAATVASEGQAQNVRSGCRHTIRIGHRCKKCGELVPPVK